MRFIKINELSLGGNGLEKYSGVIGVGNSMSLSWVTNKRPHEVQAGGLDLPRMSGIDINR